MFYTCSIHEYSVGSFIKQYENDLPQLVVVKNGYLGETTMETLDNQQTIRIHGIHSQNRVLAKVTKDPNKCFGSGELILNIPTTCSLEMCVVRRIGKCKSPQLLQNIVKENHLPVEVKINYRSQSCITVKGTTIMLKGDIKLQLMREYEKKYLYGNPVDKGQLFPNIISIPSHMSSLTLSVVTGLQDGNNDYWKALQESMKHTVTKYIKFEGKIENNEITTFTSDDELTKQNEMGCDSIDPNKLYNSDDKFKTYQDTKCTTQEEHFYEEIPADHTSTIHKDKNELKTINDVSSGDSTISTNSRKSDNVLCEATVKEPGAALYVATSKAGASMCSDTQVSWQQPESFENKEYQSKHSSEQANIYKSNSLERTQSAFKLTVLKTISSPADIAQLSITELGDYLDVLNLGHYKVSLSDALIDGCLLQALDETILQEEFGFKRFEAIKLMKFAKDGYIPKTTTETYL